MCGVKTGAIDGCAARERDCKQTVEQQNKQQKNYPSLFSSVFSKPGCFLKFNNNKFYTLAEQCDIRLDDGVLMFLYYELCGSP